MNIWKALAIWVSIPAVVTFFGAVLLDWSWAFPAYLYGAAYTFRSIGDPVK